MGKKCKKVMGGKEGGGDYDIKPETNTLNPCVKLFRPLATHKFYIYIAITF